MSRIESPDDLFAFVREKEKHVDLGRIYCRDETEVGCLDILLDPKYSSRNIWRLLGGGAYLLLNNHLRQYMEVREGKSGIIEAHLNCAYMFVQGYQDIGSQIAVVDELRNEVGILNRAVGCDFTVPKPHLDGSAKPFMINNPFE